MVNHLPLGQVLLKLVLACVFSGLIGIERETHDKPAGFRTHVLVCIGATLFTLASLSFSGPQADPGRVAANIAVGIGFLGAGPIIRRGDFTLGLTTAASLWTTAAIGLMIGIGVFWVAGMATGLVLVVLILFRKLELWFMRPGRHKSLVVRVLDQPGELGKIGVLLGDLGVNIEQVELRRAEQKGEVFIESGLKIPPGMLRETLTERLINVEGVKGVEWL